jgi:SAM-dependent methyltransferase
MYIIERSRKFMEGVLKSYAPTDIKKVLWDKEFSGDKWTFIDNTSGDCVYAHLEKHARKGSILDLGCGPGNTANELAETSYRTYVGVDISKAALAKARKRTEENGRKDKNRFVLGDFLSYVPTEQFDLILFRESIYHVPVGKVEMIFDRYSNYLANNGVFVVRAVVKPSRRIEAMVRLIETRFDILEKCDYGKSDTPATVLVFRPRDPR